MTGITVREVRRLRTFARVAVARSPVGARVMALALPHWPEVLGRMAVDAPLAADVAGAAREAARLVLDHGAGRRPVVDERMAARVTRVLDRLAASGTPSLRMVVGELRGEIEAARGRGLDEVFGRRAPKDTAGRTGG